MSLGRPPLVGRDDLLDAALRAFTSGRTSAVVIGPPGAGLTRVGEEIAAASGRPATTLRVTRAAASAPLGPLAPLLAHRGSRAPAHLPDTTRAVDLAGAFATLVGEGGDDGRLVLVDEAHLLDEASAALLHQAASGGHLAVVAVVGAGCRDADALAALVHAGAAHRVDVTPLADGAAAELLEAIAGDGLDAEARDAILRAAAGHPREIVALAGQVSNLSAATEQPGERPPAGLVERARADLEALPADLGAALAAVAVGEPLPLDAARTALGPDALDALEARGLLRRIPSTATVELATPAPARREALRAAIGAERARSIAADLADVLRHDGPPAHPRDRLQLVRLELDAGLRPEIDALLDAATTARYAHEVDVAERIAFAAHDRGAGYPAATLLGDLYVTSGRSDDAEAVLAIAMAEARTDEEHAIAAMTRAVNLFYGGVEPDLAVRIVAEAAAVVSSPWAEELEGLRAAFLLFAGDPAGAYAAVRAHLDDPGTGRPFVEAALVAAPALALAGRAHEAAAVAALGFEAREVLGDHPVLADSVIHLAGRGIALCMAGDLAGARAVVTTGTALADRRTAATRAWMALTAGLLAQLEGTVGRAAALYRRAASGFAATNQVAPHRWALGGVAMAEAARGRPEVAEAAVAVADALDPGPVRMLETEPLRGRAWASLARGRTQTAIADLERARALAVETGQHASEAEVLHDLVRIGRAGPVAARLAALAAGTVDGPLVRLRAEQAGALARRDPSGLTATADEYASIGARLFAAEAHAQAAIVHERDGRARAAAAARRRSDAEQARCEGAVTPALRWRGAVAALSEREREVAGLAADGAPSKRIAAELGVSARTVDNLLQRAYRKLGITSRADLAAALAAEVRGHVP